MRVVIADDEPLARALLRSLLAEAPDVEVVAEAGSGPEAVALIDRHQPDIAFLDVDMPGGDGLTAALHLARSTSTRLVFVTAHEPYAVDAFDVGAADYLLKPVRRARLALTLERLRANGSPKAAPPAPVFWVKTRTGDVRLPASEIVWIEAERDHVLFHTAARSFLHRITMEELGRTLAGTGLLRVHRSAFVRLDAVLSISRRGKTLLLHLPGDVSVSVGSAYKAGVRTALAGRLHEPAA